MGSIELKGKTVFITGASKGMGREMALLFAGLGAKVAVAARTKDLLDSVVADIREKGGMAASFACDIASEKEITAAIRAAESEYGPVDVLVNNAGYGLAGRADHFTNDDWRRVVDVNLMGAVYATNAVLGSMLTRRSGTIVNVSSAAGLTPLPFASPYCATKYAMVGYSQSLGVEVRPRGVKVVLVCPGPVETDFVKNLKVRGTLRGSEVDPTDGSLDRFVAQIPGTYNAKRAAKAIVEAAVEGRELLVMGGPAQLGYQANRLIPGATRLTMKLLSRYMGEK